MKRTFTHKELVMIAYKWCCKNASCGVVFRELKTITSEIPDVLGFGSWGHSVLIECKASRSDFLSDKRKPFRNSEGRGMGRHRYYCCPAGLINIEDLPEGWGLVWVDDSGKAKLKYRPFVEFKTSDDLEYKQQYRFAVNEEAERNLLYSVLRRLNLRGRIEEIYKDINGDRSDGSSESDFSPAAGEFESPAPLTLNIFGEESGQ